MGGGQDPQMYRQNQNQCITYVVCGIVFRQYFGHYNNNVYIAGANTNDASLYNTYSHTH